MAELFLETKAYTKQTTDTAPSNTENTAQGNAGETIKSFSAPREKFHRDFFFQSGKHWNLI